MIRAALGPSHRGMPLRYVVNPGLREGAAAVALGGSSRVPAATTWSWPTVTCCFAPPLLERVVRAAEPNVFLGEPEFLDTGEEINLYQAGERVVVHPARRQRPARRILRGASRVGRLREGGTRGGTALSARTLDAMVRQGHVDGDYEVASTPSSATHPFTMCPTDGLPWIEIDFPQDLHAAETEVLPRIHAARAPVSIVLRGGLPRDPSPGPSSGHPGASTSSCRRWEGEPCWVSRQSA